MQERSVRLVILLALACVLASNISANGQTESARSEVPKLPRPTGSFGVGRVAFDWIDPNRVADMAEDRGLHAELMVYVWYPTEADIKEAKGILLPGAREIDSAPGISPLLVVPSLYLIHTLRSHCNHTWDCVK
jgi:hypothetical protein